MDAKERYAVRCRRLRKKPTSHHRPNPGEEAKLRKCLGPNCGKMFMSDWIGQRLCPSCSTRVEKLRGGIRVSRRYKLTEEEA